jgi:release factor glutamine methyltransferase
LDRSIRDHEPRIALVSGQSGTEIIETLIDQSRTKLRPGGWFLSELSPMIADRVLGILQADSQHWQNCSIAKDLAGLKRLAIAQKT